MKLGSLHLANEILCAKPDCEFVDPQYWWWSDLRGLSWSGSDLRGANLIGCVLDLSQLHALQLEGASFLYCVAIDTEDPTQISDLDLKSCRIEGCNFEWDAQTGFKIDTQTALQSKWILEAYPLLDVFEGVPQRLEAVIGKPAAQSLGTMPSLIQACFSADDVISRTAFAWVKNVLTRHIDSGDEFSFSLQILLLRLHSQATLRITISKILMPEDDSWEVWLPKWKHALQFLFTIPWSQNKQAASWVFKLASVFPEYCEDLAQWLPLQTWFSFPEQISIADWVAIAKVLRRSWSWAIFEEDVLERNMAQTLPALHFLLASNDPEKVQIAIQILEEGHFEGQEVMATLPQIANSVEDSDLQSRIYWLYYQQLETETEKQLLLDQQLIREPYLSILRANKAAQDAEN